jgi:hypothetical protein
LIVVTIFFTPVTAHPDVTYLAPAFFVSLYEGLLSSEYEVGFQRGLAPILAISFFVTVVYILLRILLVNMMAIFPKSRKY